MALNIGYQPQSYQEYIRGVLGSLPGVTQGAQKLVGGIENAVGASPYAWAPSMMRAALEQQAAGMSNAEYAGERQAIGQGFNAAVGNLAARGARGGFYSPASTAAAARGRPAASLANSLQQLSATRQRMLREGADSVARTTAGLAPYEMQNYQNRSQAMGDAIGQGLQKVQSDLALKRGMSSSLGVPGTQYWR